MSGRTRILALVTALSLLVPVAAQAAPTAPTSLARDPAVTEAARARIAEGLRLYSKKRYDKAQAAFLQAYALTKDPAVLLVLGLTTIKLRRPLEALRYLEQFTKEARGPTAEQSARAAKGIADARSTLGALEIAAPDGAEIAVDGEPAGRAPLAAPIDVLPGRHEVTATTAAGTRTEAVDVKVRSLAKVRLGTARAAATSSPPAVAEAPDAVPEKPAPRPAAPGLLSPPESMLPVHLAGAVGVAALTTAIVLAGMGTNADRNLETATDALARNGKSLTACGGAFDATIAATCRTARSAAQTSADVQGPFVASLAVGAGATAFALGWYLFASKSDVRDAPHVAPAISTDGAGLRVIGTF
ncbi:MAG: Thiol-disulfide isomerase [Labilithrix sp.]|nr:Thiol-disulfide isomerase [Labilithrix sp.]